MTGRIVVVGLGPGDPGLVTAATTEAISDISRRYIRTRRHPSAGVVPDATAFDHHYEAADTFAGVYARIVDDLLVAASTHGEVLYAVPGSPRVLERTVDLLVERAAAGDVALTVMPAVSFLDLAWARLAVDPFEDGVRLVDGHRFAERAAGERGPMLVAHCHNARVLSDVKLAVDDPAAPPTAPVTVLQRLGLPDEAIFEVPWSELDRSFEPDHLTSLWIPELAAPVGAEVQRFVELVTTLRTECPWDREQTHRSLGRHLLEETYEVLEAIDEVGDAETGQPVEADAHLREELGDLLCQVVFHSVLGAERGAFTLADVARGIHDKLVHRHPHVFGEVQVSGAEDVMANWEQIKRAEKGRTSVFDGIPASLPALVYALKVQRKAASLASDGRVVAADPTAAAAAVAAAADGVVDQPDEEALGQLLMAAVAVAGASGLDPETALRAAANRLRDDAQAAEHAPDTQPN